MEVIVIIIVRIVGGTNGNIGYYGVDALYAVRPVFYLTNNVLYSSGTGKYSDPYIITE